MRFLKQSTAVTVIIGPFVLSSDGVTPHIAAILDTEVLVSKNGGAITGAKSSTTDPAASGTHGYYTCALNTTDTNTLGVLFIEITHADCLPVWHEFMVLPANTYDSLIGGTDTLEADVTEWLGTACATPDTAGYPKTTIKDGTGQGELNLTSGVVDANVTKWLGTACATPDTAGYPKVTIKSGTGTGELTLASGVAAANVKQISDDTTAADNAELAFDGTGFGFTGCTIPTVTAVTNMVTANVTQVSGDAAAADNLEAACDGTGYNVGAGLIVTATVTALGTQAKADVEAEVNDALNTAIAELSSGAPSATPTLRQAVMLPYMQLRNLCEVTAAQLSIKNDAGTTITKAALADDGTTFSKAELVAP